MIGPFLAFQFSIDINYSTATMFDESEFVVAGPGALSGISKCFDSVPRGSEEDIIYWVCERQEEEFAKRGLEFKYLGGRRLQPIDIQNLFCEVDKYSRVSHQGIKGISERTTIKQKFRPNLDPIAYFFPPKWGLTI